MAEAVLRRARSEGLPRLVVLGCVVLAALATAVRFPQALSELRRSAGDSARLSYADREIGGGNSVLPSQEVMYQARGRIGEDETYEVLVGEPVEGWTPLTAEHASGFARYFLLPRRPAPGARWILCFNCKLEGGVGELVWQGDDSVSIVRRG